MVGHVSWASLGGDSKWPCVLWLGSLGWLLLSLLMMMWLPPGSNLSIHRSQSQSAFLPALVDLRTIFTDVTMSPEFQEFAINMGIQSISMFARMDFTPFIDKIRMKDDKLTATVIETSALSAWTPRICNARPLPFALPTPIPASALPASVVSPASTTVPTTWDPEKPSRQVRGAMGSATTFPVETPSWSRERPRTDAPRVLGHSTLYARLVGRNA